MLWDLKLKVGHASRTISDCIRLAGEDFTIRTALVECRFLAGDAAVGRSRCASGSGRSCFASTAAEFIDAKLAERAERHRKQGGQRYVVEPNVKEGKGGLRDLQSLFWIGKYVYGVQDAAELVGAKVFTAEEYATFVTAEDFLWAVRCHLHLITARAMDQLTFDMQVEVAAAHGLYRSWRAARRRAFHAGLFPPCHPCGRADAHLPDRAGGHAMLKPEPMLTAAADPAQEGASAPYAIKQNRLDGRRYQGLSSPTS